MEDNNNLNQFELKIMASDKGDNNNENESNLRGSVTRCLSNCCSIKTLKKLFPILDWLPSYEKSFLMQDALAGLSVGLTAIPQSIAYAVIAGFSAEYGLYSVFVGSIIYIFFGSCKDLTIGPTAIMSLMIYSATNQLNLEIAVFGTFVYGLIIFGFGVFNLGFLVQFVSMPVITGFCTSAVFIIASAQVKPLIGIKSGSSNDFIASWKNVFMNLHEIEIGDTVLGLTSLLILIILKNPRYLSKFPSLKKYISISRNAIVVIIGMIVAYAFHINNLKPFRLTGSIKEGIPEFKVPPFQTKIDEKFYDTFAIVQALGLSLITVPLVSILETVAIAKSFSKGKTVDATQEMIALGLCNVASAFVHSMPITASFGRTAVNHNSGVRTTLGGAATSLLVLLALGLLTKTFYFIPKTTLAAVIITAIASMLETHEIMEIYRVKRADLFPFLVTFVGSLLLGLEFGIIAGIAVNFLISIYKTSRPKIDFNIERVNGVDVLLVSPDQSLNYSSIEYFNSTVIKGTKRFSNAQIILIDGKALTDSFDVTCVKNLSSLVRDLKSSEKEIFFWNWPKENVQMILRHDKDQSELFKAGIYLGDIFEIQKKSDSISQISEIAVQ